jgi:hypothetical protein
VTRRASLVAYMDDFKLMLLTCMAAAPLVFIIRQPLQAAREAAVPRE